jgi:capsular polysaccharide transport system permease protein
LTDYTVLAQEAVATAQAHPDDAPVAVHAAMMLFHAGDIQRALHYARAAVSLDDGSSSALRVLSGILNAVDKRPEAIEIAEQAVRIAPVDAELRLHLGGLLAAESRWKEAAAHLSEHVVSPAPTAHGWRLLSAVLNQLGRTERATAAAREAVVRDPGTTEYRLHLASLLSIRALHGFALREVLQAHSQDPENPSVWSMLSAIHAALGELPQALRAAEKAVELAGQDTAARAQLAYIAGLCAMPVPAGDRTVWSDAPVRVAKPRPAYRQSTLSEDLATRWQVIFAIMLRDIRTRFGHTRLGYFWAIMEPITHLLTLGTVFYFLNHGTAPVGDNLFLYYITGLVPFLMFSHVSHDIMSAGEANNAMLHLPIVKRTDIMVAHALRQFGTELCVGIIIFSVAGLLGHRGVPADPLTALAAVTCIWLLAVGVGAFNLIIFEMFPSYETIYAALLRLLYVASGIYYSPLVMPDWARDILIYNPILQGIEFFRSGFFTQYDPHWVDVPYLLTWIVASIGIGFALERAMRHRMVVYS